MNQSEKQMNERYFYHCFPRRFRGDHELHLSKGLEILRSIHDIGFILTPEITEWREPQMNGTLSKLWTNIQKRCCFTELQRDEVKRHSDDFGSFSLEFDTQTLRQLGGIPVFYLPRATSDDIGLESLAASLVARLGEIQDVLNRLAEMAELIGKSNDKSQLLGIKNDNTGAMGFFRTSLGGAEDVLALLTRDTQSVDILRNALRAVTGFFYPAEDFKYTGLLAYYRQREWRVIANMSKAGVEINRDPLPEEVERFLQIDPTFFGKEMKFRTGPARIVDQCRIFSELDGKPIYKFATRIVVPEPALEEARAIFNSQDDPPVVPLDKTYGRV